MKRTDDGKLVLERRACFYCNGTRSMPKPKPCPVCGGNGRTKGGRGKGTCRKCGGSGNDWSDRTSTRPCHNCTDGTMPEDITDTLPPEVVLSFPLRICRSTATLSFMESHVGVGLMSCVDYGAMWARTDAEVVNEVRNTLAKPHQFQACKLFHDDLSPCDEIVVLVKPQGYSIVGCDLNKDKTEVKPL